MDDAKHAADLFFKEVVYGKKVVIFLIQGRILLRREKMIRITVFQIDLLSRRFKRYVRYVDECNLDLRLRRFP